MSSADEMYAARVSGDLGLVVNILRLLVYGARVVCWAVVLVFVRPNPMAITLVPITFLAILTTELSLLGVRWMKASLELGEQIRGLLSEQLQMTAAIGTDLRDSTEKLGTFANQIVPFANQVRRVLHADLKGIVSQLHDDAVATKTEISDQSELIKEQRQYLSGLANLKGISSQLHDNAVAMKTEISGQSELIKKQCQYLSGWADLKGISSQLRDDAVAMKTEIRDQSELIKKQCQYLRGLDDLKGITTQLHHDVVAVHSKISDQSELIVEQCQYLSELASSK